MTVLLTGLVLGGPELYTTIPLAGGGRSEHVDTGDTEDDENIIVNVVQYFEMIAHLLVVVTVEAHGGRGYVK